MLNSLRGTGPRCCHHQKQTFLHMTHWSKRTSHLSNAYISIFMHFLVSSLLTCFPCISFYAAIQENMQMRE